MFQILLLLMTLSLSPPGTARTLSKFSHSKVFLKKHLHLYDFKTLYCSCEVTAKGVDINSCGYRIQKNSKRAERLEWEHVVPAEAFGRSFFEWRSGSPRCVKKGRPFKGRRCAEKNAQFNKMEADLYNLFPEIGELNGIRFNYSMAALTASERNFGQCQVKLADRKFEPQDLAKGIVARTYLNFEKRYPGHGVVSEKNRKLFEAWDRQWPVTRLECRRWQAFESVNGYRHLFADRCGLIL